MRTILVGAALSAVLALPVSAKDTIQIIADNVQHPGSIAVDQAGNVYVGAFTSGGTLEIGTDGSVTQISPDALRPLVFDADGNLYGENPIGGPRSAGTVVELSPNGDGTWTEQTIYSFCSQPHCRDGFDPDTLTVKNGRLYGTTYGNPGTVFELVRDSNSATGWRFKLLARFTGVDAGGPTSLVAGAHGVFYGSTAFGQPGDGCGRVLCDGTVFKLNP